MSARTFLFWLCLSVFAAFRPAMAATAEDYLHGGAGKYISGRLQEASIEVEEGLRHFPQDAKLNTLASLLKQMKDQQKQDQQGGDSQKNDDQNKQKDKDKNQGKGSDQDKQKGDKDSDKNKDQEQPKDENDKKDKEEQDQNSKQPPRDSSGKAGSPVKPGQMSKEDAERLLNSYQDDEKKDHQRQGRPSRKVEVEEDW